MGSLGIVSCGGEDLDDLAAENYGSTDLTASFNEEELVGHWVLSSMTADQEVDLNGDGIASQNLLQETSCFDDMSISFFEDGSFSTVNARLNLGSGDTAGEFGCSGSKEYQGTWEVDGDYLVLNMNVNGNSYTERKFVEYTAGLFSFAISKLESDAYVDDPGDTVASGLQIVELEYSRDGE